ncbi:putative methyltransferase-domain-containing protein [Obelidium mucronatum]|nr:putative methyltransferase-domain-containing protein [Obelidium mucronatum]
MEDTFESLQTTLDAWIATHEAEHGHKPPKARIEQHPAYRRQTSLLMARCPPPAADACARFMRRKKKFCTKRRTPNDPDGLCGLHRAEAAVTSSLTHAPTSESKKSNISKRMKRMLNPFRVRETDAAKLPVWSEAYLDMSLPLWVDIGCAKGRYLMNVDKKLHAVSENRQWNFCGVELFAPLVEAANLQVQQLQPESKNLFYVHANINKDLERLQFPNLRRVSFLFPDPWSCGEHTTSKNAKKRVMNPDFALRISKLLPPGGDIYFATDWLDLALDIRKCLLETGCFDIPSFRDSSNQSTAQLNPVQSSHIAQYPYIPTLKTSQISSNHFSTQQQVSQLLQEDLIDVQTKFAKPETLTDAEIDLSSGSWGPVLWLAGIPYDGVQTERDLVCEAQWRAIYRLVLVRNSVVASQ